MASRNSSAIRGAVDDYMNIRTVPATLMVAFVVATLYTFGFITSIGFAWGVDYTIQAEHAALVSLGTYAVAFASSETKSFEHYEPVEQAAILAGPAVLIGWEYVPQVVDLFNTLGDPLGSQLAALVALASYVVTVQ